MKLAFMTFSTPELSLDEILPLAKRLGYDGIELRIDSKQKHGVELTTTPAQRSEIRKKAKDSGAAFACVATSVVLAHPETHDAQVKTARQAIALAHDINCRRIRIFGGGFPESSTRKDAQEMLLKGLRALAGDAQAAQVTICVETHDSWCDPRDLVPVIHEVNSPAVRINWDILHPQRTAGMPQLEAYELVKPWVAHCHYHDGLIGKDKKFVTTFIGEGDVDHRQAVKLLTHAKFDGYMSGEWIGRGDHNAYLARELATMRQYEREARR